MQRYISGLSLHISDPKTRHIPLPLLQTFQPRFLWGELDYSIFGKCRQRRKSQYKRSKLEPWRGVSLLTKIFYFNSCTERKQIYKSTQSDCFKIKAWQPPTFAMLVVLDWYAVYHKYRKQIKWKGSVCTELITQNIIRCCSRVLIREQVYSFIYYGKIWSIL